MKRYASWVDRLPGIAARVRTASRIIRGLSGRTSSPSRSILSPTFPYIWQSATTNSFPLKREQTIWSSSPIGLIHQRFAPKDCVTIPTIINSELIITGFKQGWISFRSDNASPDQFDDTQVSWIERTLARDETDGNVHTIVVGMHDALPDSISTGHGMNESAQMEISGRRIYRDLLAFRAKTNKYVYVLASHSHFLIEDVYNDACHQRPETLLRGWIIGTAGAIRYRLPANLAGAKQARTDVYGYPLGTVQSSGEIHFAFQEVQPANIPRLVRERYGKQVQACFEGNKSTYAPSGPSCTASVPDGN
jgi:hypothetical protein